MPFAEANGQRLYYEVHGEGEPLLCVMGLGADHTAWALQVPEWSQRFSTIVFDNRDCGQSSTATGEYEIADMARDALALADALGLESFHLVGMSMGGAIAQELALAAPDRVRTLTLCVTWPGSGPWGVEQTRLWTASVLRTPHDEHIDHLLLLCFSERFYENPEGVAWIRQMTFQNPHPQTKEGFVRQAQACGRHGTQDRLGALSMPVHVIGAEHDVLVPVWKSQELAELIPGAKLTIVAGAPHGLNIERAEEFNRAVTDFLAAEQPAAA